MMRPLVKATSSRISIIPSQPVRFTAGPMNLEQMSRSLRSFLFIGLVMLASPQFLPFVRRQRTDKTHEVNSSFMHRLLNLATFLGGYGAQRLMTLCGASSLLSL